MYLWSGERVRRRVCTNNRIRQQQHQPNNVMWNKVFTTDRNKNNSLLAEFCRSLSSCTNMSSCHPQKEMESGYWTTGWFRVCRILFFCRVLPFARLFFRAGNKCKDPKHTTQHEDRKPENDVREGELGGKNVHLRAEYEWEDEWINIYDSWWWTARLGEGVHGANECV